MSYNIIIIKFHSAYIFHSLQKCCAVNYKIIRLAHYTHGLDKCRCVGLYNCSYYDSLLKETIIKLEIIIK